MALSCSSTCGTPSSPPSTYGDCGLETRDWGFSYFLLFKCDATWTDILDTTEWTNKLAANDVAVSPIGVLDLPKPSFTTKEYSGCGQKIVLPTEYPITFKTLKAADDLSDFTYWKSLFDDADSFTLGFVDCEGNFYLDDNWIDAVASGSPATVAGENPGFDFSITEAPHPLNDEGYFSWNTAFEVKKSSILQAAKLPGVYQLLNS